MKIPTRSILAVRNASKAVATAESFTPAVLSSELFDHIRHQVYGGSTVDKMIVRMKREGEDDLSVLANRNVSTSFSCLSHVSKQFANEAVLIEVDPDIGGSYISSVHQPIRDASTIQKITFDSPQHALVNEAYWRSCSFVTAAILKEALACEIQCEFPERSIQNGFFSLKVKGLEGKIFTPEDLSTINKFAKKYIQEEKPFEVIALPKEVAEEHGILDEYLVRIGFQVFSSSGHVIRSTRQIGRYSIFQSKPLSRGDVLVGAVSVPTLQVTSSYSWSLIVKNAIQKFSKTV